MNLKKGIVLSIFCFVLTLSASAQEYEGGHTTANITYYNAPIYKILDSRSSYVVLYGKYGAKIGTVTIPKKWAKWQKNTPRKLTIRKCPNKINPYITIVKKDNSFLKVVLTVPTEKTNRVWGVAAESKVDSTEPDSIELELR